MTFNCDVTLTKNSPCSLRWRRVTLFRLPSFSTVRFDEARHLGFSRLLITRVGNGTGAVWAKQRSLGASSWYKSLIPRPSELSALWPSRCLSLGGEALLMLSKYSFPHSVRSWKSLAACGSALVIAVLVYRPVRIEGNSMAPLPSDHELIFLNRLVYHFQPLQRSDVVRFWYPQDRT